MSLVLNLRIDADADGLVGEVRLSREELAQLQAETAQAGAAAARAARGFTQAGDQVSDFKNQTRELRRQLDPLYDAKVRLVQGQKLLRDAVNAGTRSQREAATISRLLKQQYVEQAREARNLANQSRRVANDFGSAARGAGALRSQLIGLKAAITTVGLGAFVRSVTQANLAMTANDNIMQTVTGSHRLVGQELAFVRAEAERLGLVYQTILPGYAKIAAAARNTSIEGEQQRQVFSGVIEATQRALTAIEQIMSKGTVQAEELRGQLGDHIPGAFQIAARAMGVTTAALNKMLEQGRLLSEDFLPKFAQQLSIEFAAGAEAMSKKLRGSLARAQTAWFDFRNAVAEGGVADAIQSIADDFVDLSKGSNSAAEAVGVVLGGGLRVLADIAIAAAENIELIGAALVGLAVGKTTKLVLGLGEAFLAARATAGGLIAMLRSGAGLAFLGGPIGAAISIITAGLAYLAINHETAAQAAERQTEKLKALGDELDRVAGIQVNPLADLQARTEAENAAAEARIDQLLEKRAKIIERWEKATANGCVGRADRLKRDFTRIGELVDKLRAGVTENMEKLRSAIDRAVGGDLERAFIRTPELFGTISRAGAATTSSLSNLVDPAARARQELTRLNIVRDMVFRDGGSEGAKFQEAMFRAEDLAGRMADQFNRANKELIKQGLVGTKTQRDYIILARQRIGAEIRYRDVLEDIRKKAFFERAVERLDQETRALDTQNKISALNLELRGANADATRDLVLEIIDLEEAQALANLRFREEREIAQTLPKDLAALGASYDRLEDEIRETFDARRTEAFAEAGRRAAQEFRDAWSNTISYIDGAFSGLLRDLTGKFGRFGGLLNAVGADIIKGLLPTGSDGNPISIGSFITGGIGDAFGLAGATGDFSFSPATLLSNIASTLNNAVSAVIGPGRQIIPLANGLQSAASNFALSWIGQSLGLSTGFGGSTAAQAAAVTGPELGVGLTPGGSSLVGAAGQFGSLAVAPFLGMMASAIITAFANSGDDGPAFGTRLGVNKAGLLEIAAVTTDDGFSSEIAQQLAELTQTLSNSFLTNAGITLREGAFRGELAFNEGRFKASADTPANAAYGLSTGLDVTGILGLNRDSRHFNNVNQAAADFVARNLFLAVEEGAVDGLTGNQSDVFRVGLGNLIRQVRDDVTGGDGGLDLFTKRLDFLTSFARIRETLDSVAVSADDAAARLAAAAKSQDAYAKALDAVRAEAKAAAVSGLAGLGDFIDEAHRLFDPTGGLSTQIRLRLTNGADSIITNGGLRGGLDVVNASVIDRFFDTDNGVDGSKAAAGFRAHRLDLLKRFEAFGVGFTNTGLDHVREGGAFGEHGQPNVFNSDGGDVRFNQPGVGGGYNLTIDAAQLVQALTGSEDLDFGRAILDPIFAAGTELIIDSFRVATAKVDEFFASITGADGLQAPVKLIEEMTPAVSPLVQQFETLKAQIEATRPDLQALNEDFAKFGVSLIDIDGKIAGATETVRRNAQDQFLAGLGITVDGNNQVQTGVDVAGVMALAQAIKDQEATAATLFETDTRGVLPQISQAILAQMTAGIETILSNATNADATTELIRQVFGDRVAGLDFSGMVETATESLETFASVLQGSTQALDSQISTQRNLADAARRVIASIDNQRFQLSVNDELSPFTARQRFARAEAEFDRIKALALGDGAGAEAARGQLGAIAEDYLSIARDVLAGSDAYAALFNEVDAGLLVVRDKASQQLTAAEEMVSLLTDIRDALAPANDNRRSLSPVSYASTGDGQFRATSNGVVGAGFDLGYKPDKAIRILIALATSGLSLPSGFGEGQIRDLVANDGRYGAVLSALGYSSGGLVQNGDRRRDSVLAALQRDEFVIRSPAVARIGVPTLTHINATGALPPAAANGGGLDTAAIVDALRREGEATRRQLRNDTEALIGQGQHLVRVTQEAQAARAHAGARVVRRVA